MLPKFQDRGRREIRHICMLEEREKRKYNFYLKKTMKLNFLLQDFPPRRAGIEFFCFIVFTGIPVERRERGELTPFSHL